MAVRAPVPGIPEADITARSKGEIALCELDRVRAAGVRFGTVLADAAKREAFARGYGTSAAFRHGLDERGLRWAVGIARNQKVYDTDVHLVPPTGRARKLSRKRTRFGEAPDKEPQPAECLVVRPPWQRQR